MKAKEERESKRMTEREREGEIERSEMTPCEWELSACVRVSERETVVSLLFKLQWSRKKVAAAVKEVSDKDSHNQSITYTVKSTPFTLIKTSYNSKL